MSRDLLARAARLAPGEVLVEAGVRIRRARVDYELSIGDEEPVLAAPGALEELVRRMAPEVP